MTITPGPRRTAGALLASLTLLAGCSTAGPPEHRPGGRSPELRLVAFDSCQDVLRDVREKAKSLVGPWGMNLGGPVGEVGPADAAPGAPPGAVDDRAATTGAAGRPGYSGTNTHEAGVDEPDLVKTDGRRIVTVNRGRLRVVDPATRRVTGQLDLGAEAGDQARWSTGDLLLAGDHALVLVSDAGPVPMEAVPPPPAGAEPGGQPVGAVPGAEPAGAASAGPASVGPFERPTGGSTGTPVTAPRRPVGISGPLLLLVDLSGTPKVLSSYRTDGSLVDARQVGGVARVVVRSWPRLTFSGYDQRLDDAQRTTANRAVVDRSTIEEWLPRFEVSTDGRTSTGVVPCDRVSRPTAYTAGSLVTVLSFDLTGRALTDGDPVTVFCDGQVVYGTGSSLYLATDERWRAVVPEAGGRVARPADAGTRVHRFDVTGTGRPRYVTSAEVPGHLVDQYALSEWDGHLRVATTSGDDGVTPTSSAVYVLTVDGLRPTGEVTGLGRGERIHSVRFDGGTGHLVTFRRTDPLYSLDLRDPAAPKVTGELKVTGYSSYLHPLDGGRLLGIGQEATAEGRVQGTQVSLFDVRDPAKPVLLARHRLPAGFSEAESDPHAFLYWPADRLLVVPDGGGPGRSTGALVLRVGDRTLTEVGGLRHPGPDGGRPVRRSLVVDSTLWTVSDVGLLASDPTTLATRAWLPFT
jgi:hypothetical protein